MKDEFLLVDNVEKFLMALEKLSTRGDYVLFYRGHADYTYKLIPSVYRRKAWIDNEDKMFREILLRCPQDFTSDSTTFQKLVRMQHYSLPTRLLDITENPLIALYNACVPTENKKSKGEVIIFKIKRSKVKYFDSDTVSIISNLAKMSQDFNFEGESDKGFNSSKQGEYLLHEIRQEKPGFRSAINLSDLETVQCVKPMLDNQRIIRQDGAFFIFGMGKSKKTCAQISINLIKKIDGYRLVIAPGKKEKILKQLEKLSISRAKIYPEIDQVAFHIKDKFSDTSEKYFYGTKNSKR